MTVARITIPLLCTILMLACATGQRPLADGAIPEPPDVDLWIMAGQSNMMGSAPRPAILPEPHPRVFMYGQDNAWHVARVPIHRIFEAEAPVIREFRYRDGMSEEQYQAARERSLRESIGGLGPGLFFARHIVEHTDARIALVPNSPGGSAMDHWDPALRDQHGNSLYGAMMDRIESLGRPVKGLIWYQGESEAVDADRHPAYEQKLRRLFESIRKDTDQPDLPILFVQISRWARWGDPGADRRWESIRESQRRIAATMPHVYMVSAIDLPLADSIHIDAVGQAKLGRRLAELALTHVYGLSGTAQGIRLASIEASKRDSSRPEIMARFEGVSGSLTAHGRPHGFALSYPEGTQGPQPQIFRVDFHPSDPAAVILRLAQPLPEHAMLVYAPGSNPFVNITDEADMPIPAFGPLPIP